MGNFLMFILYVYHCQKSKIQFDVEGSALLNIYVSLYISVQSSTARGSFYSLCVLYHL